MKKKFTLLSLLLAMAVGMQAQDLTPVDAHVWNFSDWDAQTFEATTIVDNLEVAASSDKTVAIDSNNKSIDGFKFTKRLKFGGTGSAEVRNLHFKVAGPCDITVYGMSGSKDAERTLNIATGSFSNVVATLVKDGNSLGKVVYTYGGGEADVYIYSAGSGFNVYYVEVGEAGEVVIPPHLEVTEANQVVLLTKENITAQDYLSTTTEDWANGKNYSGFKGDFYNMSKTARSISIKVTGAQSYEVFVQNGPGERTYTLNGQEINHGGTGIESSGVQQVTDPTEITTITLAGTGSSVYPVYFKFYTHDASQFEVVEPNATAFTTYSTLVSARPLNFAASQAEAFIATKLKGEQVYLRKIDAAPAGTPVILKPEGAVLSISVIQEPDAFEFPDVSDNKLKGEAVKMKAVEANEGYVLYDDAFHPCLEGYVPAGKAYLAINVPTDEAAGKVLTFVVDDQPTGITVVENAQDATEAVYNLNGVRVSDIQQKGVYIVNGKKVVK